MTHPGRPNRMRRLLIILFALAGALPVPSGAQTHTARVAVLTPYPINRQHPVGARLPMPSGSAAGLRGVT
jgi:hypothetical protein